MKTCIAGAALAASLIAALAVAKNEGLSKAPVAISTALPGLGTPKLMAYALRERIAPFEILDAVSNGQINSSDTAAGNWAAKAPAAPLFSAVPLGPDAGEHWACLNYSNGLKVLFRYLPWRDSVQLHAARRAAGIGLSNHGDRLDVIMDSGVQRGAHVLEEPTLGAKAVGWHFLVLRAAAVQSGDERALGLMRVAVGRDLKLMGATSIARLGRHNVQFCDPASPAFIERMVA